MHANTWALLLAGGDGTRLRDLTTTASGTATPKQFCSLRGGPSLLHEAMGRARAVTSNLRTCVAVTEHHRRWWQRQLWWLPPDNRIVQPENRGTAVGMLLSLLHIIERDPTAARIVVLPSDHHVRDETVLAQALRAAVRQLDSRFDETLLLGVQPDQADPQLGYIVPGRPDGRGAWEVEQFIEKPNVVQAQRLIAGGALWNSFILVSTAPALLALFRRRIPEVVRALRGVVQDQRQSERDAALAQLYSELPEIDFSRDILLGQEHNLRLLSVPPCGWSDLGTPERVASALSRAPSGAERMGWLDPGVLNLAVQHELQHERMRTIALVR